MKRIRNIVRKNTLVEVVPYRFLSLASIYMDCLEFFTLSHLRYPRDISIDLFIYTSVPPSCKIKIRELNHEIRGALDMLSECNCSCSCWCSLLLDKGIQRLTGSRCECSLCEIHCRYVFLSHLIQPRDTAVDLFIYMFAPPLLYPKISRGLDVPREYAPFQIHIRHIYYFLISWLDFDKVS